MTLDRLGKFVESLCPRNIQDKIEVQAILSWIRVTVWDDRPIKLE